MSKVDDGGPAYPVMREHSFSGDILGTQGGMSLRDWFAGQALAGMNIGVFASYEAAAREAYIYADAMLAERNK